MKNIYNIFEENSDLYNLLKESEEEIFKNQNDIIEWQTSCYMEDLVLEQMIYEDFDVDNLEALIEGKITDRLRSGALKLKEMINKFINWIDELYVDFSEKMNVFKKIFDTYGRQNIHKALSTSEIRLKTIDFNSAGEPMQYLDNIVKLCGPIFRNENDKMALVSSGFKSEVFKALKVESIEDLKSEIKNKFVNGDKPVEKQVKDLDPSIVIGWLEGKAHLGLNSYLKWAKRQFGEIKMQYNMNPDKKENVNIQNIVSNCSFMMNLLRTVSSTMMSYIFKITTICKTIILRILGKTDKESRPDKNDRSNDSDNYWDQ